MTIGFVKLENMIDIFLRVMRCFSQHSKHNIYKRKISIGTFLSLFFTIACMGQMHLTLKLPKFDSSSVEIQEYINVDSTFTFYTADFNSQELNIILNIQDSILANNPVYKFIVRTGDMSYESSFAGERDTVIIDLENYKVYHQIDNIFYNLTELSNKFIGDSLQKKIIIQELSNLFMTYPNSAYIHFILYNSIKSKLLSKEELANNFQIENNTGMWLNALRNHLLISESTIKEFHNTLAKHTALHEFVLLKFWGSWCKPCLEDDIKLKELLKDGAFKPFIIGIQNDKKESQVKPIYFNILDKSKSIISFYNVNKYPTYILYKNSNIELNTTSLQTILDYFKP